MLFAEETTHQNFKEDVSIRLVYLPNLEVPSGNVAPVQKISAATASLGQMIESRFSEDDCALHNGICPA